jgi:serine phosphatase RsbU (regulator of sigma subunit)
MSEQGDNLGFEHIYLNFYSFGTLLVTMFTALLALFFLTIPDRSKSTFHIGLSFLFLCFFNIGYFFAAFYYHPGAAYHRWLTGGFILPVIIHFGQFFFKYPKDIAPKLTKYTLWVLWSFAILTISVFLIGTYLSDKRYHFTGHYWDFDSPTLSVLLSVVIAIYTLINFLIIPIWKFTAIKGTERKTILKLMIAVLIAGVIPNFTNIMSRDGSIDRATYLISVVILFVLGFFFVSIFYINSTKEKTTFMAKIVGLTLVTVLLVLQAWGIYIFNEEETEYNRMQSEKFHSMLATKIKKSDVNYIVSLDNDATSQLTLTDYPYFSNLDLFLLEVDIRNTMIYEDIHYIKEDNFQLNLKAYLDRTHPYFIGYKNSILDFWKEHENLDNLSFKKKLLEYMDSLNRITFIHSNKISQMSADGFCKRVSNYIKGAKNIQFFKEHLLTELEGCNWKETEAPVSQHKRKLYRYIRFFKPNLSRNYRMSLDSASSQKHYISYIYYNRFSGLATEIGFSYIAYRERIHSGFVIQSLILVVTLTFIITFYPLFFRGSLVNPLNSLLTGVTKVNSGNLEIEIPIEVRDEIGFLSESFNSMVVSIREARSELQDYAENLEEKVQERTKELEHTMQEINKLKVQQDGDYYLTSLLSKPLFYNANKSGLVTTEVSIIQKKQFEFRNRKSELGGDICVTGNIKLGTPESYRKYVMAMNGDAMGKSMQGAGGSLIMGVMINSIMRRSAENKKILNKTPEKWLTDTYNEIHEVFKTFNGTMVISCVVALIDEESGEMFYFNAEHPFCVLFRSGEATFVEKELKLRKLGLDSEIDFEVLKYQLIPGDVLLIGSDGRDDIDLSNDSKVKDINTDESLFLAHVQNGKANIGAIIHSIQAIGSFIDDFSLIRVGFREDRAATETTEPTEVGSIKDINYVYSQAKGLLEKGKLENSKILLEIAYNRDSSVPKVNKLYGMLSFKTKNYEDAIEAISKYIETFPDDFDMMYYLSLSLKKVGRYNSALEYAQKIEVLDPENILNLLNICDIYRLLGNESDARQYASHIKRLDPENRSVEKLMAYL